MPAATAAFDDPFAFDLRALPAFDRRALPPALRDAELRLRDDAEEVRRLEAVAPFALVPLFGLLREAVPLLFDPPRLLLLEAELRPLLLEALRLLGLDPFELREFACRLLEERDFAWATAPP
jgi:hypothetical protein